MQDRDSFSLKLEDTENWLYEEGEDQQKQVYIDKLAELKVDEMCYWFVEIQNCCLLKKNEPPTSFAPRNWESRFKGDT